MSRITFESLAFGEALRAVLPAAAKSEERAILHSVRVDVGRGKVELVACDNYRIARALVAGEVAKSGKVESFTLRLEDAKAIAKALPASAPKYGTTPPLVLAFTKPGEVKASLNGWSLTFGLIDGTYPNFEAVMPKGKPTYEVALNATLLGELLAVMGKNQTVVVEVRKPKTGPYAPVVIRPHGRDGLRAVLMNVRLAAE